MINPNKNYKASQTGTIKVIESRSGDIDKFIVSYGTSGEYSGYVSAIKNFKRFKVGDQVKCQMRFSICLDKFLIVSVRKAAA